MRNVGTLAHELRVQYRRMRDQRRAAEREDRRWEFHWQYHIARPVAHGCAYCAWQKVADAAVAS